MSRYASMLVSAEQHDVAIATAGGEELAVTVEFNAGWGSLRTAIALFDGTQTEVVLTWPAISGNFVIDNSPPIVTGGGGPVDVWLTDKSPTGVTVHVSAPFTGEVDVMALGALSLIGARVRVAHDPFAANRGGVDVFLLEQDTAQTFILARGQTLYIGVTEGLVARVCVNSYALNPASAPYLI